MKLQEECVCKGKEAMRLKISIRKKYNFQHVWCLVKLFSCHIDEPQKKANQPETTSRILILRRFGEHTFTA